MATHQDAKRRRAKTTLCRGCGSLTISGVDSDLIGLHVVVDAKPINPQAEEYLVERGFRSVVLVGGSLHWRWQAGSPSDRPILIEHRCGLPTNTPYRSSPTPAKSGVPDEPSY